MAVTNIPNVQNWTVTPQNGQSGYFDLMNTWLGQSTLVIASLQTAITAQNLANTEINALATDTNTARDEAVTARDEAVTSLAILSAGSINDTTIATNKTYSNSKSNTLLALKMDKDVDSLTSKTTPIDADELILADSETTFTLKKLTWVNLKNTLKAYFDPIYANFIANDARVKTAVNATGPAPIYACRAWVIFNGTGTVAISWSGNVSSVTDKGVGNYSINFITPMSDENYSWAGNSVYLGGGNSVSVQENNSVSRTASTLSIITYATGGVSNVYDSSIVMCEIFR